MPNIGKSNFNIVCAVGGAYLIIFGLVSYFLKENLYLAETLFALLTGIVLSPGAANFLKPLDYALGDEHNLAAITLYFSRLVLGIQLVLAGVQLPKRYLKKEWRTLALLLGPIMTTMWLITSMLVWAMVPKLPILHALAIGACVTPTDPVLSNSIVQGRFANEHLPEDLRDIIVAESGANDGLGYPFLFLALYLEKYVAEGGLGQTGGARKAMGLWFGDTLGYTILFGALYGCLVGWCAKKLFRWAKDRKSIDRESFLIAAIAQAIFIVGTAGLLGTDDVLACFIAGNFFTWDDWFRLETLDDSLQPTMDMLINAAIFIWYGAVCPWHSFAHNSEIPLYRLVILGILVLLLRRLPVIFVAQKKIPQIEEPKHVFFMGFFGPIGVSAIFYLNISLEFLDLIRTDGENGSLRPDAQSLSDTMSVVVWFLVISSVVVHGLTIPLGKLGLKLSRKLSNTFRTPSTAHSSVSSSPGRTPAHTTTDSRG